MKLAMLSLALLGAGCVCGSSSNEHLKLEEPGVNVDPAQKSAPSRPNTEGASARPEAERQAAAPGRPQLANSPEGLMLPGGVLLIQQALTSRGYLHEAESGALDDATSVGLRTFQSDQKLARTGAPDRETLHRLGVPERKGLPVGEAGPIAPSSCSPLIAQLNEKATMPI